MENNFDETTAIATIEAPSQIQPFASKDNFELAMRMANALSQSSLVPPEYQGKGGLANCLIALEMAGRVGISPFMTMQNLYVIHGRPSWSSKFLIAMINASGRFEALQYRFNQDKTSCVAFAKEKATGQILEGPEVSIKMAEDEGWLSKNGSKWKTMPEVMLRYRAAAFFERTYCPELSLGLHTVEEAQDIGPRETKRVEEIAKDATEEILNGVQVEQPTAEATPDNVIEVEARVTQTKSKSDAISGKLGTPEKQAPQKDIFDDSIARQSQILDLLGSSGGGLGLTPAEQTEFIKRHTGKQLGALNAEEAAKVITMATAELQKRDGF